jgi:hypothetical protein
MNTIISIAILVAAVAWGVKLVMAALVTRSATVHRQTDNEETLVLNVNFTIFDGPEKMQAKLDELYALGGTRRKQRFDEFQAIVAEHEKKAELKSV